MSHGSTSVNFPCFARGVPVPQCDYCSASLPPTVFAAVFQSPQIHAGITQCAHDFGMTASMRGLQVRVRLPFRSIFSGNRQIALLRHRLQQAEQQIVPGSYRATEIALRPTEVARDILNGRAVKLLRLRQIPCAVQYFLQPIVRLRSQCRAI